MLLAGCATPAQHFAQQAAEYGFVETSINGSGFQHRVYANELSLKRSSNTILHVYLDGDGTPWTHQHPAEDPTSRNSLILSLMVQDSNPSILLGRPCYHGFNHTQGCDADLWTAKRYAAEVVESMATALNHWLEQKPYTEIVLIGYSGGGTIAVLMAEKIPNLKTVVTIAANLDVTAWSQALGYEPLPLSLNPSQEKKLSKHIKQLHLAGANDEIVPAVIVKSFAEQQSAEFRLFPDFNHQCCWQQVWQQILQLF